MFTAPIVFFHYNSWRSETPTESKKSRFSRDFRKLAV
ncbi:hypothetical protein BSNT_08930 [Bacillus subtilis subsp. natto BEST195]|nr:hypothetical protein BSNT_08930 [Bacillus subtilis subsp. natto BEST195]